MFRRSLAIVAGVVYFDADPGRSCGNSGQIASLDALLESLDTCSDRAFPDACFSASFISSRWVDHRFALEARVPSVAHGSVSVAGWVVCLCWASFAAFSDDAARLIPIRARRIGHELVARFHSSGSL